MLFYGLRKFARELGLEVQSGVVCGIYERYAVSMWDNVRYKTFSISAKFDDDLGEKMQMELIELESKYRRSIYIRFWEGALIAKFFTYPETMKQFRACFFDVLSLLNQYDIPDADICPRCGLPMHGQGVWSIYQMSALQSGIYAHENCMAELELEIKRQMKRKQRHCSSKRGRPNSKARYLPGWIGALAGCILSTIIFIVGMLSEGSYNNARRGAAACCGGLIVKIGYDMTGGIHGKKRSLTIVTMTIMSIVLGIFGFFIIQNAIEMNHLQMIPEGISEIEACRLYIQSGIQAILEEKVRVICSMCIFIPVSMIPILDIAFDLYYGEEDRQVYCKRLYKRK